MDVDVDVYVLAAGGCRRLASSPEALDDPPKRRCPFFSQLRLKAKGDPGGVLLGLLGV